MIEELREKYYFGKNTPLICDEYGSYTKPAYSAEDTIGYLRELAYQAKDYILSDIPLQQTSLMV